MKGQDVLDLQIGMDAIAHHLHRMLGLTADQIEEQLTEEAQRVAQEVRDGEHDL